MKYIRTKDGIYQVVRNEPIYGAKGLMLICERKISLNNINSCYYILKKDKDIIKQADTIEDLCDEFVMLCLCDGNGNKQRPIVMQDLSLLIGYMGTNYGYAIYGAIWTDKGLIYVAKMNEKGELELL